MRYIDKIVKKLTIIFDLFSDVPIIKCQNSEVFAKVSGDVKFICVVRSNPSSDIAWLSSEGIKYGDKYSRFTIEYQVNTSIEYNLFIYFPKVRMTNNNIFI